MAADTQTSIGEEQARRLEAAVGQITAVVQQPDNAKRLRDAPGENEWNVIETLGHCNEMIPYWLKQCQIMMQAEGSEPPPFGRAPENAERLAGVERGAHGNPEALLAELHTEAVKGAAAIRVLTAEERGKQGLHPRRGVMTVGDVVENMIVAHAEEHQAQIQAALA